jgi:hypothetical protein
MAKIQDKLYVTTLLRGRAKSTKYEEEPKETGESQTRLPYDIFAR